MLNLGPKMPVFFLKKNLNLGVKENFLKALLLNKTLSFIKKVDRDISKIS